MEDRVHFEFRAYPAASSPEGILLNYLKSEALHPGSTKNDLVLKALKICWMPYAYREAGLVNNQELLKIANSTIHNLEWHIREIRFGFGLESVPPPAPVFYTPVAPVVPNGRVNPEVDPETRLRRERSVERSGTSRGFAVSAQPNGVDPETEETQETGETQKWLTLGL